MKILKTNPGETSRLAGKAPPTCKAPRWHHATALLTIVPLTRCAARLPGAARALLLRPRPACPAHILAAAPHGAVQLLIFLLRCPPGTRALPTRAGTTSPSPGWRPPRSISPPTSHRATRRHRRPSAARARPAGRSRSVTSPTCIAVEQHAYIAYFY